MFDISKAAVVDTAALHIKNAKSEFLFNEANEPCRIVLYGPGSKAFSAVEARQSARALARMQNNDNKVSMAAPEERAKHEAEDLAAITVRFENFAYPIASGAEGAAMYEAMYADPALGFIVKQVTKFVNDWGNFTPGSAGA